MRSHHTILFFILYFISSVFNHSDAKDNAIKDGSVIAVENGFLSRPIEKYTSSPINHLAIILNKNGTPIVYESIWPKVHKVNLRDYIAQYQKLKSIKRNMKITIYQPDNDFSKREIQKMKNKAENQLGRVYQMRNYWRDFNGQGTHCSQFVAEVLDSSGRYSFNRPWRTAPVDVVEKIKKNCIYDELVKKNTESQLILVVFKASWCGPCKKLNVVINSKNVKRAIEKSGYTIATFDIDKDKHTARAFKVTSVPTILIVKHGQKRTTIKRTHVGSLREEQLIQFLDLEHQFQTYYIWRR